MIGKAPWEVSREGPAGPIRGASRSLTPPPLSLLPPCSPSAPPRTRAPPHTRWQVPGGLEPASHVRLGFWPLSKLAPPQRGQNKQLREGIGKPVAAFGGCLCVSVIFPVVAKRPGARVAQDSHGF